MSTILTPDNYYFDKQYITHSMIKDFLEKGEYYYYLKHIKGFKEKFVRKDYFDFGTAVDIYFEGGPEEFKRKVHIVDRRTGNVPFGHVELTKTAGDMVLRCIDEMLAQPLIRYYNNGQKQAILQVEDYRGCKIKGKLDILNVEQGFISDIKTTANIENFDPHGYDKQLAMYGIMAEIIYGKKFDLVLCVVDKYDDFQRSEVFKMSDDTRERATDEIHKALATIKDRMEFDTWAIPIGRNEIYGTGLYKEMPNYKIQDPIIF